MKKFKEYLYEMPVVDASIPSEKPKSFRETGDKSKRIPISKIGDNTVHKLSVFGGPRTSYTLHDKEGNIRTRVAGMQNKNAFVTTNLESSENAPVKAHHFYHHLIVNHNIHLHSDSMLSPGAIKVWSRLHAMPGIQMQTYNVNTKKYTNLKPGSSLDRHLNNPDIRFAAKKRNTNITEAPIYNTIEKEPNLHPYHEPEEDKIHRNTISKINTHTVSELKTPNSIFSNFALHEPSGKISLNLTTRRGSENKHYVTNLNGFGNKVPAHEFYHHLITNHGIHLHSDYTLSGGKNESKGAIGVWQRLHQNPDIKVQAFHMKDRTYTDIPKTTPLTEFMNSGSIRFAAKKNDN